MANAKINSYIAANGNIFYFQTTVAETSKPACNSQSRFAVNTTAQSGKDIMEAVINAKNANLSVNVSGTGTCTISSTSENANYVTVFGTSAMVGPRGLTGATGVAGPVGPRGLTGVVGATGARGPAGPPGAPVKSVAVCAIGGCSCSGRELSAVGSNYSCAATSETGSCNAQAIAFNGEIKRATCCVCGA